jgi:fibronectin type 3 domain-containing protein
MSDGIRACVFDSESMDLVRRSEGVTGLLPPVVRRPLVVLLAGAALLAVAASAAAARETSGPIASTLPRVAGSPTQGSRLVASHGSWTGEGEIAYAYQWYRCDAMGARCVALRGVTSRTRRIGPNDVGHTLSLSVRATDATGSTTAYASLVGPIAGTPPALVLKAQPLLSGDSVLGGTIRVDPGSWRPKPSAFSYQWVRCNVQARACAPIGGETTETHQVGEDDLGHALVAIVQARSGTAARAVFSVATPTAVAHEGAVGPSSTGMPMVAAVIQQGEQLNGATGSWSGSGAIHYRYQWYRCDVTGAHCKSIRGATAATYTQVAKDVGRTLGFTVHASDATGTSSAYASLVGPVAAADTMLVSAGQPTITGAAMQGQVLQVSTGAWTQTPTSFGYQWQRCNPNGRLCTPIAGATASTYTPSGGDVGHALLAVVTAAVESATQDALSVATRPIATAPGPMNAVSPVVTGTIQQGKQLTGSTGTWTGVGQIGYAYQWYRCDSTGAHCKSIHGATAATYTQVAKDVGQTLGFAVRATDATGTATVYTGLVGLVAGAAAKLVATAQPTIDGSAKQGQTLHVSNGSWNQDPTAFSYQWQRCNANRRVCVPIPGATASSYTLTAADAGQSVLALVQAVANGVPQATLSTTVALS